MEENLIYFIEGETIEVHPSRQQEFENENPSATQLFEDAEGKLAPKSPRALLEEMEARFTALDSGESSLESPIPVDEFDPLTLPTESKPVSDEELEEIKKYEDLKEQVQFLDRLEKAKQEANAKGAEGFWDKVDNSITNIGLEIQGFDDRLVLTSQVLYRKIFGEEAYDNFLNNPEVSDFWKIGLSDEEFEEAYKELEILDAKRGETGSITEGFQKGDLSEMAAGIVNGVSSLGSSLAINYATFGAGIYTDFFARSFINVNETKAERLGTDFLTLVNSGKADFYTPLATSTLMGVAERFGLKKVQKAVNAKTTGFMNSVANRLVAGTAEGATEFLQHGIEVAETSIAKGNDAEQVAFDFVDGLVSQEGFESFLQGMAGGGIITTAANPTEADALIAAGIVAAATDPSGYIFGGALPPEVAALAAYRLRTGKGEVEQLLDDIKTLKQEKSSTKDKDFQTAIENAIVEKQNKVNEITKRDNIIINNASEQDLKELGSIKDLSNDFVKKSNELKNRLNSRNINQNEYDTQYALLKENFNNNKKKLQEKLGDINLKNKNISDKNAELIKIIKENKNPAAVEKAKNDLVENNKGFIEKLIKSTFNPNLNTELTEADYRASINLEFAKIINTYKIKENVPFGAYLQQNLPKRLPAIFDLAIETTPEGEMVAKTDVTQERNIIDDTDLNLEAATPETSSKILSKTGISEQDVDNKSKEILKSKLPGLDEKVSRDQNPFLTAIEKAAEGKFFETIYKKLGGNYNNKNKTEWESWLDENIDDFLQLVEESGNKDYNRIKNKMLRGLYKGKKKPGSAGRAKASQGGTAAGEGRYDYQIPTRQEAIDYFSKGGLTTLVERKKTLTKILSHATGKKGVANVINDPDVQKDFVEIQKLLGKEVPQNVKARIIAALDRVIKTLESAKPDPNILRSDFGVGSVVELGRRTFLNIAKKLKLYLEKDNFNTAIDKAIQDAVKELNLSEGQQKIFVTGVGVITLDDILTGKAENIVIAALRKTVKERFKEDSNRIIKNIKEKLNDKELSDQAKADIVADFFKYEHSSYVKNSETHGLWKKANNEASFKYWEKQFGINLGKLGFSLQGGKNKSIYFKGKKIVELVGRPSSHQNKRKNDRETLIQYYEKNIEAMDNQAEMNKNWFVSKIANLLLNEGKQAAFDFISISGLASDGVLRMIGKLRYVENAKGPFTYEHTPPINDLQQDMYDAINSTNNISEILINIDNILSNSSVDFISDTTMEKVNAVNKTTGKTIERYKPGNLNKEGLQELKRPKQKAQESTQEKDLNKGFNKIIEQKTGVKAEAEFGDVKGRRGQSKRSFKISNLFVPPTAEDLNGLMYALLPKGKQGDVALKWIKENIYNPFSAGIEKLSQERMAVMNDYNALKKKLKNVPATLKEKIDDKGFFTKQDAVRVWIWNQQGMEIPGLSKTDKAKLIKTVNNNKELIEFATQLISINKAEGYVAPDANWDAGTISTDLLQNLNTIKRAKFLEQWQNNVDTIFNESTMNKLKATFGESYVASLKDILRRMKTGKNRLPGGNKQINNWLDWLNNSVGAIMFLNVRSAVLQIISTVNYMNWSDNNPLMAAKAFANQKQFWADFSMIFNSDYLKERRGGLQLNVQESEIADMAKKRGVKGVISGLLNKGFVLTRMADSFAIANGGAAMYRNRVNSYLKQGLSQKEAETKAFQDFRELTEEAQQSSRPDRISKEQASTFGRVILAFANTPMQYTRLMKRAGQDLVNRRGDTKTNISKLIYYGTVQNFIFNGLQQALFALGFDEDEEEEKVKEKYANTVNGMIDSILRGTGVAGNAVMVGKNFAMDIAKRSKKPRPNFSESAWKLLDISPPLDSKVTKIRSALYTLDYSGDAIIDQGLTLQNPGAMAIAQTISATTNVPMDRVLRIYDNVRGAVAEDTETWQRVALLLGWSTWELGIENESVRTTGSSIKKRSNKIKKRSSTKIKKR